MYATKYLTFFAFKFVLIRQFLECHNIHADLQYAESKMQMLISIETKTAIIRFVDEDRQSLQRQKKMTSVLVYQIIFNYSSQMVDYIL